jgi:hypothetical protein
MMHRDAVKYLVTHSRDTSLEAQAILFCVLQFWDYASAYPAAVRFRIIT